MRYQSCFTALLCGVLIAGAPLRASADADSETCTSSGTRQKVRVDMVVTTVGRIAGFKIRLGYPDDVVTIPGQRDEATVKERVTILHEKFLASVNDQGTYVQIVAASGSTDIEENGPVLAIEFDRCQGGAAPNASEFTCEVLDASDAMGIDARGVTCSVAIDSPTPPLATQGV